MSLKENCAFHPIFDVEGAELPLRVRTCFGYSSEAALTTWV